MGSSTVRRLQGLSANRLPIFGFKALRSAEGIDLILPANRDFLRSFCSYGRVLPNMQDEAAMRVEVMLFSSEIHINVNSP